jgi:hypothetical protein
VFRKFETPGDFAVGEALRQTPDDINFARRKKRLAIAAQVGKRRLSQGFENELQFAAAGPNLASVHALNALGQQAEGFGAAKHALGASPKSFNDRCPLGRVQQHDHSRRGRLRSQVANQIEAARIVFSQLRTDDDYLGFLALDQVKNCCFIRGRLDHLKLRISSQSLDQKLCAHGGAVRS